MPRKFVLTILLLALPSPPLLARLPKSLARLEAQGARVGAIFVADGKVLEAHREKELFNPASVTKVFTAALALSALGESKTLETKVVALGPSNTEGVIAVVGSGDPTLTEKDLKDLAKCLKDAGIRKVNRLLIDLGPFDSNSTPPAFDQKATDAPYRAGIGGFQVNQNFVVVSVAQGHVTISPPSQYVTVINEAKTTPPSRPLKVVAEYPREGGMVIRIQGTLGPKTKAVRAFRVPDPPIHAGYVFRKALEDEGIEVAEGPILGEVKGEAKVLCLHRSPPIREILIPMLKDSQNQIAESLLRLAGAALSGSKRVGFIEGQKAMARFLAETLNLTKEECYFSNGSGLYNAGRCSPRGVARLLEWLAKTPSMAPVLSALPVGGIDGTLKRRFRNSPLKGRVLAKTGTLDNVVALAGYVHLEGGKNLIFAVMVEGVKRPASARKAIDQALEEIVTRLSKKSKGTPKRR